MGSLHAIEGGFEPARAFASVAAWMRRTVEAGGPVTDQQVLTWAAGIDAAAHKASAREDAAKPRDRISAEGAEAVYEAGLCSLARLAVLAQDAATKDELKAITRDTESLCRALELLARGVIRPAFPHSEGA